LTLVGRKTLELADIFGCLLEKPSLNPLPLPLCSSSSPPEALIVDLASTILSSSLSICWRTPSHHDVLFQQVPFGFHAFESSPASSALPCLASPPSPTQLCWRRRISISTHQLPLLCLSLSCSLSSWSSTSSGSCNGLEAAASRTGCPADFSPSEWQ